MGLKDSYLSQRINGKKAYQVDMVTVVTQEALNSQIRAYLANCHWKNTVYFLETVDDEGDVVTFMLDKNTKDTDIPKIFGMEDIVEELRQNGSSVYRELDSLKLFSIPAGTASSKEERLQRAMELSFGYAVELEDGIPDVLIRYFAQNKGKVDLDKACKIIEINPKSRSVIFEQIFRNIKIARLSLRQRGRILEGILMVKEQKVTSINPENLLDGFWTARSSIAMDLRSVAHRDIKSEEVRDRIEEMSSVANPDTVFDISQLVLDLSTLQIVSPIDIQGVEPAVKKQIEPLLQEYFVRMEKAGQTVFGHIVLPKPAMNVNYLFTPTKRNFAVAEGALYYLINLEDGKTPVIPDLGTFSDFNFAPVLESGNRADGAMIINATKFIPFLRGKFEPALQKLALDVNAYADVGVYKFSPEVKINASSEPQRLTVTEDEPWKASWSYRSEHRQKEQMLWAPPAPFPVASGKIDSRYEATCESSIGSIVVGETRYPSYDFLVRIRSWMNFGYNSGSNEGYYYDKTIRYSLGIKINADGKFDLIKKVDSWDNKISDSDKLKLSGWGKFCTFGALDGMVRKVTDKIDKQVDEFQRLSKDIFLSDVNTFAGWFMPGCRTFTYKDEGISDYGDLYSSVNYVQE